MTTEELDRLCADSKRLHWLLSGHTVEELAACSASGLPPEITPQDECLNLLASWYCTLDESLATIDKAMLDAGA